MINRIASVFCAITLMTSLAFAAGKGPEIQIIDGKVSMEAESVPLGRLLKLLDAATGMTSKVPPELANRNISVRFSGLPFNVAIKKMFEGQALDYVLIGGKGITVTSVAQATGTAGSAFDLPAFPQAFNQPEGEPTGFQNQFPGQVAQQPQTPFGPQPIPPTLPNQQGQPLPGGIIPGQAQAQPQPQQQPGGLNAPFGANNPFNTNPGNPFGANPGPFGAPPAPGGAQGAAPTNPLFGNTSPSIFGQNPTPAK
jgi:hypothetical protein